jgi:hypothetical protein
MLPRGPARKVTIYLNQDTRAHTYKQERPVQSLAQLPDHDFRC